MKFAKSPAAADENRVCPSGIHERPLRVRALGAFAQFGSNGWILAFGARYTGRPPVRMSILGQILHFSMNDVTRILSAIEQGDSAAAEQLLPLVYAELRKLAASRLAQEKPGQTLQATALVHEAYLRLLAGNEPQHWNGRGHFFGAAAEAMRRILVDLARRKRGLKRGGDRRRVALEEACLVSDERSTQLLALDEALEKLEAESPEKAQLVKLRYFAGLSHQEAAEALGISRATADRYWAYAKVFLHAEMEDSERI